MRGMVPVSILTAICVCGAQAAIVYVDLSATGTGDGSSWTDAFVTLQDGLGAAVSGDQVYVAEGTYYPDEGSGYTDDARDSSFRILSGIDVHGGYPAGGGMRDIAAYPTILSGDLGTPGDTADNAYHVIETHGGEIDGFTIRDGCANGSNDESCGGGILSFTGSTIRSCTITQNRATNGGGIYIDYGTPTISGCLISENRARYGGGIYIYTSSATVEGCTIAGNRASSDGGGIRTDCWVDQHGTQLMTPHISNCLISGNAAGKGGGMHCTVDFWDYNSTSGSQPVLTNCTIVGNQGGGMCNERTGYSSGGYSRPVIRNSIIWWNSYSLNNNIDCAPSISYSNVQGCGGSGAGWSGAIDAGDNIDVDPLLVTVPDPDEAPTADGDFHFWNTSPCLDTGDNTVMTLATDLEGDTRIQNTTVDLGAYEGGEAVVSPTIQASTVRFTAVYPSRITVHWNRGDGNYVAAFMLEGADGSPSPLDNTPYSADTAFGSGNRIGTSGWYCVFNGVGDSVTVGGLSAATTYRVMVCEYNGGEGSIDYLTTTATANPVNWTDQTRYYVDKAATGAGDGSSWADAMICLQDALAQARFGDSILVATGTYYPDEGMYQTDDSRTATFAIPDSVRLYGGYPTGGGTRDIEQYPTILSGDLDQTPDDNASNAYHVVTLVQTGNRTVLDGFTITGGNANGAAYLDQADGAGIWVACSGTDTVCEPAITNCTISGNDALKCGGGLFSYGYNGGVSCPVLTNCTISGNTAGSYGGGVAGDEGDRSPYGLNSVFRLVSCLLTGNESDRGGGFYFEKNSASTVRGVIVTNCTIARNTATRGSALYFDGYAYTAMDSIRNSIVWGNITTDGSRYQTFNCGHSFFSHCIVETWDTTLNGNGFDGGDNSAADPGLISLPDSGAVPTTAGDFRVAELSPCIDAANGEVAPELDIDGNARFDDPGVANSGSGSIAYVDIGAYERRQNSTNHKPSCDPVTDPAAILEDAGEQTVTITGVSDGDGGLQKITATAASSNTELIATATATWSADNGTVLVTYTPEPDAGGTAVITVTIDDNGGTGNGGQDTCQVAFTVTVTGVNDAPSFTAGADQTVDEDAGAQTVSGWATAISPGPGETDQTVSFSVTTDNDALFGVLPALDAGTGDLTFSPADDANGSATVSVRLSDDGGTANGGVDTSTTRTFSITVAAVNDAPVIVAQADTTVNEAEEMVIVMAASDSDAGDELSFSLIEPPSGMTIDATSGELTWTPGHGDGGDNEIVVLVEDQAGGAARDTFVVTVNPSTGIIVAARESRPPSIRKRAVFAAMPNPVGVRDREVALYYDCEETGTFELCIYDCAGNLLYETRGRLNRNRRATRELTRWNLVCPRGKRVGAGTYLAVLRMTYGNGDHAVLGTRLGVAAD